MQFTFKNEEERYDLIHQIRNDNHLSNAEAELATCLALELGRLQSEMQNKAGEARELADRMNRMAEGLEKPFCIYEGYFRSSDAENIGCRYIRLMSEIAALTAQREGLKNRIEQAFPLQEGLGDFLQKTAEEIVYHERQDASDPRALGFNKSNFSHDVTFFGMNADFVQAAADALEGKIFHGRNATWSFRKGNPETFKDGYGRKSVTMTKIVVSAEPNIEL